MYYHVLCLGGIFLFLISMIILNIAVFFNHYIAFRIFITMITNHERYQRAMLHLKTSESYTSKI